MTRLLLPPGTARIRRIHGAYVPEKEILEIVDFVKKNQGQPEFLEEVTKVPEDVARALRVHKTARAAAEPPVPRHATCGRLRAWNQNFALQHSSEAKTCDATVPTEWDDDATRQRC